MFVFEINFYLIKKLFEYIFIIERLYIYNKDITSYIKHFIYILEIFILYINKL